MSEFLNRIKILVRNKDIRISEHGYDELADDGLTAREVFFGYAEVVTMAQRKKVKYVHEGRYVAEVEVALLEDDTGWSPYISIEDAFKLDDVRDALRHGDLKSAAAHGQIYELRRVSPSAGGL